MEQPMTIAQAKDRKDALKSEIKTAITDFEDETGLSVEKVRIRRLAETMEGEALGVRVEVGVGL